jgi:hypothetical protein
VTIINVKHDFKLTLALIWSFVLPFALFGPITRPDEFLLLIEAPSISI